MKTPFNQYNSKSASEAALDYWREQAVAYRDSQLSMKKFCQQEGLAFYQFRYWFYRLPKIDALKQGDKAPTMKPFMPVEFIEPKPEQSKASPESPALYVHWGNGTFLLECAGLTIHQTARLMSVLGECYAES